MAWELFQASVVIVMLASVLVAQRFWFGAAWRWIRRVQRPGLRWTLRGAWAATLLVVLVVAAMILMGQRPRSMFHQQWTVPFTGLWLTASLFAYLGIKGVNFVEGLWARFFPRKREAPVHQINATDFALPNPARRTFFQTAGYFAGAVPFVGGAYGFLIERLHYSVERVEVPIAGLPEALDGLRIVQLSDIHIGAYMPPDQVRRAVDMANELGADLVALTGDYLTRRSDPLPACVEALADLRAPLGAWGCLGNHEIYARAEEEATQRFAQAGVRILRQENAQVSHRGQAFNLIGVDYQRSRWRGDAAVGMLSGVEKLVRRDVPNLLLSHNPNAFLRAPQLGIELTLAGHTHGGQVQVEILERHLSPARFLSPFTAGLYPAADGASHLYVNRGIGTVGAPIRFNAPPEITLLTLRRA